MIDIADDTHISNNAIGTNPTISFKEKTSSRGEKEKRKLVHHILILRDI